MTSTTVSRPARTRAVDRVPAFRAGPVCRVVQVCSVRAEVTAAVEQEFQAAGHRALPVRLVRPVPAVVVDEVLIAVPQMVQRPVTVAVA